MPAHIPVEVRLTTRKLVTPSGCWEWQGARTSLGYGSTNLFGSIKAVHRLSYELYVGPIPEGLHLDHLCRNPPCYNPAHLEAVTHRENMARGLHRGASVLRSNICQRGHAMTPESVYVPRDGRPRCRACRTINQQDLRLRRSVAATQ